MCHLGHDHTVIAPGPRDEVVTGDASNGPMRANGSRSTIRRLAGPALPYDRTYHLLGRFDKIRSAVRSLGPDILEAHSPYLAVLATIACGRRAARARTAFWHADHLGTYVEPALRGVFGGAGLPLVEGAFWAGMRRLLSGLDAVFVAGAQQAQRLRRAGVRRVVHVPFGVDVSTFRPEARSEACRDDLRRGASGVVLVGVGRLSVEKRWDVVIDACARVRSTSPVTLVLFGDGPERARLERRAGPGVRFAGFERDPERLAAAVASADMLVHGCPSETFGLAVAEAVACATPVVVPEGGGAAESAETACSERYRSGDAASCAAAIRRLLGRQRDELEARARLAASRVATAEQHFASVLSVYEDLLEER